MYANVIAPKSGRHYFEEWLKSAEAKSSFKVQQREVREFTP